MHRLFIYNCNQREKKPAVENIGRYLVFRLPATWDRVQIITIEKPVAENIGLGFGMVFLVYKLRYMYSWPGRPPSCVPTSNNIGQDSEYHL